MGVIYILTAPNDKSYIGQHKSEDVDKRIKSHISGFNIYMRKKEELEKEKTPENRIKLTQEINKGCISLYRAFAKHGPENFTYDVLHSNIPLEKLNEIEDQCIIEYDTLSPNGYNLRLNNHYSNGRTLSDESKKRFSDAAKLKNKVYIDKYRRYKDEMKDMPQYVSFYNDKDGYRGYKIMNHPNCDNKSFTSKTIPLDVLKQNCLVFMNTLNTKYVKKERNLPVGIFKPKHRNGYMAYFKYNKIKYSKYFSGFTDNENFKNAVNWLTTKKSEIIN